MFNVSKNKIQIETQIAHLTQIFVRKIIRVAGDRERLRSEIGNELRVITKLRENGGHPNVINVLKYG